MNWPIWLVWLLAAMNAGIYLCDVKSGLIMTAFVLLYVILLCLLYAYYMPRVFEGIVAFSSEYGQLQKKLLEEHSVPYAILDENGKILWMNRSFSRVTGKEPGFRKSITAILPEVTKELLQEEIPDIQIETEFTERQYRVEIRKMSFEQFGESGGILEVGGTEGVLNALYLYDVTALNYYMRENREQMLVVGLICLDNYEEALETVDSVKRSMLVALIDRRISQYIDNISGITKKIEKDKYFAVFKEKYLAQLQEDKFSILDEVKTVYLGNEMSVTLSIGIGTQAETYAQNYEYARKALDLALGRGGDQAVVKEPDKISYYGGKSKQVEKTTRVKARVKAHALREIISTKDKVVVMGHRIADVDSLGAAIGIYRAAVTLEKTAHVVINEITTSVKPLIEEFRENQDYPEDMFINSSEAMEIVDGRTVVVVVDVNKPSYTECSEILGMTRTVVVLDHHRQAAEKIENAVLSYVEPYASSTCEMVSEILQYFGDNVKIRNHEADCMYAGILIDTNNFMRKAGVRTFEAAAHLRRCGADVTRVNKMFRNDMKSYKARAEAVRDAEVYKGFAISVCPGEGLESPTVVGAQAANELLNITGVRASVVLTEYNDKIYLSARSIDEINVQILMERLGGGGHMDIAGSQLEGYSLEEARQTVKKTISDMLEGGDL